LFLLLLLLLPAEGHPLGQFTINHFARIESGIDRAIVRYVVDYAEVPTYQEAQTIDVDQNGEVSQQELSNYLDRVAPGYIAGLELLAEGKKVDLTLTGKNIQMVAGSGGSAAMGLATMRMVFDLAGRWNPAGGITRLRFEDKNLNDRGGWRELVVTPAGNIAIFDTSAYGNGITDELKAYPEGMLNSPLNERSAEWKATIGEIPAGATLLKLRDGRPVVAAQDRFAALIAVPNLTPGVMLLGLLIAFVLGGMHAMSPGHGKTIVGAYLVGTKGTATHAGFLGLTVTITHTIVVFSVGLIALFASKYILPETLFPVLSFLSGAMVVAIGLSLFRRRVDAWTADRIHEHDHGPGGHSHLPVATRGDSLNWRDLFWLGVSGGILPCPSAMIVMLASISLQRIGYGLVLIVAFSLGLATVLTVVGLIFVYAGKLTETGLEKNPVVRILPIGSALVVAGAGMVICYQALRQAGVNPAELWNQNLESVTTSSILGVLLIGLFSGLWHALDADHLAAVSTIVSERKKLLSSMLVGSVWGIGHTLSLLIGGIAVIVLRLQIGKYEKALEFCVALMLIGLGINVLVKLLRGGKIHLHKHVHGERMHTHPHLHAGLSDPEGSHHGLKLSLRPLLIGMMHGLAGSAALILAVIANIKSVPLQFATIAIFGIGSIGGMALMSLLLSLPLHLTVRSFTRTNLAVRALAGCFSLGFGLFLAYEIGYVDGLLR
jgi:ABC-type nickel/cobalt efflux system permease component RcnA